MDKGGGCLAGGVQAKSARGQRILSLDGGGTWALIQIKALMHLYGDVGGHDVLKHFDLAIANSGGSIALAALAVDLPLARILALFLDEAVRRAIFKSLPLGPVLKDAGLGPRYRASEKLPALQAALGPDGDRPMREWRLVNDAGRPVKIVLCGFDYDRLREVFFRTQPEPLDMRPTGDGKPLRAQLATTRATFAEAVHASTNAPVAYFDAPAEWGEGAARFWDGAMGGYNNPVLAGVVEAARTGGPEGAFDRPAVRVLSLGSGSVHLPEAGTESHFGLVLRRRRKGLVTYMETAGTCILDDPPDAASYVAHVMLGGRVPSGPGDVVADGPVVRMSPLVQPVPGDGCDWTMPSGLEIGEFRSLLSTGMDALRRDAVARIVHLADLWLAGRDDDAKAVRNQPIRASRWLEVEIGQGTFGAARRQWEAANGPLPSNGHADQDPQRKEEHPAHRQGA